jgi:NB-ARC domain
MYGAIAGHIAVGRYVLEIGDPCGALLRDASRAEPAHTRSRPTPVLLRPALMRGLVGRQPELDAANGALDASLPLEVTGAPGVGKTALLRHLAHHPRAGLFADGIVYVSARHQSPEDLLRAVFEAFYESDEIWLPTEVEIRRGLQGRQALILLDDVDVEQDELEHLFDIAPRCAFVVSTRRRRLWGEGRTLMLKGLPSDDAVRLLEHAIERPLDDTERSAAENLCVALEGHPLRIVQAAALTRDRGTSLDGWAPDVRPESLITELLKSIDERQRRALLALTALPGVPLHVQQVAGIAELTDIDAALTPLVHRGLIVRSQSRLLIADGVVDRLRRREDLTPWVNRAITYFTAWAERNRRSPVILLEEAEALLRVQQDAAETRRWGEVLRLGRLLEGALVIGGRWGAWAITVDRCLAAAKATGDRSAEAWALHEIGTRAVCLGETGRARALLGQAVKLRESIPDDAAAAASRQNLVLVAAPVRTSTPERATPEPATPERATPPLRLDLDALPIREPAASIVRVPKTRSFAAVAIAVPLLASVGWFAGVAYDAVRSGQPSQGRRATANTSQVVRSEAPRAVGSSAVLETAADVLPPDAAAPETGAASSSIIIFTARPGSVATTSSTQICYAVSGAYQARIEPGIGEVEPTPSLSCRRVAPRRTTTYELTAYGRDGRQARQRLVVFVK